VARPGDDVSTINAALARGENLLLTPGVYTLDRAIEVKRPDTVVLGLGLPSLTTNNGATLIRTANVPGIDIAGVTLDAGPVNSPVLLQVGDNRADGSAARDHNNWSDPADPTALQDVFFRIGGPHLGKATTSLEVNSDFTILDDIWAWRADHGAGVGWTSNTADHGVIVNADDVTATGLFVEHFQKEDVLWNGERGIDVFFQNETPYDPPSQSAWDEPGPVLGYPAFRVADDVQTFHGYGMGSYVVFIQTTADVHATEAYQAPVRPGVQFTDIETVYLGNQGGYDSVIDGVGGAARQGSVSIGVPVVVTDFPS
jgi:hypothetical protein